MVTLKAFSKPTSFFSIVLCLFFSINGLSQNPYLDSLTLLLDTNLSPKHEVDILLELTYELSRLDNKRAQEYGERCIQIAKENNLTNEEMSAKHTLGVAYKNGGKFKEALVLFNEYLPYVLSRKDSLRIGAVYSQFAAVNKELNNLEEALRYYLLALPMYEQVGNKAAVGYTYSGIGLIYKDLKQYDSALNYQLKALEISRATGHPTAMAIDLTNVGNVYFDQKNYDNAMKYYQQSLALDLENNDQWGLGFDYHTIGIVLYEKGEYEKSFEHHNKALTIRKSLGVQADIAASYYELAGVLIELQKEKEAVNHLKEGLKIAQQIGSNDLLWNGYEIQAKANFAFGHYKEAYTSLVKSMEVKDSLLNANTFEQMANMLSLYEAERKDAEIIKLQNANLIASARQRNLIFLFTGILLSIIGLSLFLWFRVRYRQQQQNILFEKERADKLTKLDQLKDQFLANTSHELRTPLNGMVGLVESLKDGIAGPLNQLAIDNLNLVAACGKRLGSLVNDILDFSKLKNRDLQLQLGPVDIRSTVNIVFRLSKHLLKGKPIQLVNDVPPDLPPAHADENRVQQILHNLIDNAIKFTDKGNVVVTCTQNNGTLSVSVRDEGIGIASQQHETIFQSFEQVEDSLTREYTGTGLGLTVSKQLVELHGGKIAVDSAPGEGATFQFTLPVSTAKTIVQKSNYGAFAAQEQFINPPLSSEILADETVAKIAKTNNGQIQILVVDDEPINRKVLDNHLTLAGYKVTQAINGPEALSIIKKGHYFDLIILDIMMPKMSGYEVCHHLRDHYLPSELPVIMLTAKNRVTDLVEGFNVGANDYLIKPFSKDELLSRIKTHLNLHQIHRASGKFVPVEFLKAVGREAITDVKLGDHAHKEVTVFFSDIRNYTSMSEQMNPEEAFIFINDYVGRMGPVIQHHEGFINQYLGDGIMAIFPKNLDQSLSAAIEMQKKIHIFNNERTKNNLPPISVGMGLHVGPLIMGIIGDENRIEPATIADTVNAASRMEGLTKFYGARIIFSNNCLDTLQHPDKFHFRYLGEVQVKGKEEAIGVYECFDGDTEEEIKLKKATLATFKNGIENYYQRKFKEAVQSFNSVLELNQQDTVAQHFYNKANHFLEYGISGDWTGIERIKEK